MHLDKPEQNALLHPFKALSRVGLLIAFAVVMGVTVSMPSAWAAECGSTSPKSSELDRLVEKAMVESGTPGVAIGVIKDGQIIYLKGHGETHRAIPDMTVNCRTRFHVASLSKPVVATALMTAFERGEIRETETLADVVAGVDADLKLTDLMTHTAGVRDWGRAKGRRTKSAKDTYIKRMLRRVNRLSDTQPFHYSDLDYNLLGIAIEHRSGVDFATYVKSRVFAPLGMSDSSFTFADGCETGSAWPHVGRGSKPAKTHPYDLAFAPSSGLQTSAHDMTIFMQSYLSQDERLMSKTSYSEAIVPMHLTQWEGIHQSLVWQVLQTQRGAILQHGGSDRGFRALMTIYPSENAGIIILANGERIDRWALRAKIEELVLDEPNLCIDHKICAAAEQ